MSRLREINLVAFTKLRTSVSRMHKIFVCSILRTSFPALRDALLKSALVLCYRRVFPRNFFPCAICRRQCVLPQDSLKALPGISLFLYLSSFSLSSLMPNFHLSCALSVTCFPFHHFGCYACLMFFPCFLFSRNYIPEEYCVRSFKPLLR